MTRRRTSGCARRRADGVPGRDKLAGRGQPDVVDIGGPRPYVRDCDVVMLGNRAEDEDLPHRGRQ